MASLAEQLVAGPRGRRLCLSAVSFTETVVSRAVFDLRFELEIGPKFRLRVGDEDETPFDVDATIRVLRGALGAVKTVEGRFVHLALEGTVNGAMYWQGPDGDEVLASRPEIAAQVVALADLVAASPVASWWTDGVAVKQFQVRMDGWREDLLRPPAEVALPQWAEQTRSEEARAAAERPSDPQANYSGTWWSVPPHGLTTTCPAPGDTPSGLYLVEDGFGETRAAVHRVASAGKILEIDSVDVWADLCRSHPLEVTASKRHDWYRTTGLADTRWVMPDWASVAGEYDAVHLQVGAYLAASGTAIAVDDGVHSVIAGWAPGDTYWLTDVVEVDPVGRAFAKSEDTDLWHPA